MSFDMIRLGEKSILCFLIHSEFLIGCVLWLAVDLFCGSVHVFGLLGLVVEKYQQNQRLI